MAKPKDQKNEKVVHPVESAKPASRSEAFHGVNKEFEQVLSALNPGENLEIERPPKKRGALVWIVSVLVVALVASAVWFFVFQRSASLAEVLPQATSFYVSLALPSARQWSDRIFFWRQSATPGRSLSRLYQKLDIVSWPGVDWQKQILPLLKNKIELGRLDNGTLIFKAELADKGGWLAVAKAGAGAYSQKTKAYQGEITRPDNQATYFGGLWQYLTKNTNKINWLVKNNDLYISDQPNFESYFGQTRALPKFERGMIQAFVKDKGALESLDSSWGQFFASGITFPFKLVARDDGQSLVWYAGPAEKKFTWGSPAPSGGKSIVPGNILSVLARNPSQLYGQWQSGLLGSEQSQLTKNINELSQVAKEFYGLEVDAVFKKIGSQEIAFNLETNPQAPEPFLGSNWSLRIEDKGRQADNELLEYLKKFATALFAITHPQAVEHRLNDGTTMVELRATRDGLEWQPLQWTSQGQQYSFYSLRGQGEETGYFIGYIPAKGYFLTSSLSLIGENIGDQGTPNAQTFCAPSFEPAVSLTFPAPLITADVLFGEVIGKISLMASADGVLSGCFKY